MRLSRCPRCEGRNGRNAPFGDGDYAEVPYTDDVVTAYGDDERRRMAQEYGAAEVIAKPVDFDLLKSELRELSNPTG